MSDFWKDYEPEPHKGLSEHIAQATNGRVCIDPVTGDVGIGTPEAQRQWVEVEQVKWDGEKFIARLKEKNT